MVASNELQAILSPFQLNLTDLMVFVWSVGIPIYFSSFYVSSLYFQMLIYLEDPTLAIIFPEGCQSTLHTLYPESILSFSLIIIIIKYPQTTFTTSPFSPSKKYSLSRGHCKNPPLSTNLKHFSSIKCLQGRRLIPTIFFFLHIQQNSSCSPKSIFL